MVSERSECTIRTTVGYLKLKKFTIVYRDVGKMKKRTLVEESAFIGAVSRMIRTTPLIREMEKGRKKPANMIAPRH